MSVINKKLVNFTDIILYKLYYKYGKNNHGYDHIVRTIMGGLVFLKMYQHHKKQDISYILYPLFYSCLFHDSGRKGRDGDDIWEKESSEIAEKILKQLEVSPYLINQVKSSIYKYSPNKLLDILSKGADSLDIMRVTTYNRNYNPFYKYLCIYHQEILTREFMNEMKSIEKEEQILIDVMNNRIFQDERKETLFTDSINLYKTLKNEIPVISKYLDMYIFKNKDIE